MHNLQRTQIYLAPEQIERLKSTSYKEHVPMSELIRRAIDHFLDRTSKNRKNSSDILVKSIGKISLKTKTASQDHDRYLYGA